jgi:homoserine dehydrogenase
MRRIRLAIVGFGAVGRWLATAIWRRRAWLEAECGVAVSIVSVATRGGGFVHYGDGFDIPRLLAIAEGGRPLAEYPGARQWGSALDGLAQSESDVLAEASNTNPRVSEPALSHIRLAIDRGMHVITSSKGACAAAAIEMAALARKRGVAFRMESTVMSGTPVLSTLRDGLAGARVVAIRGILNGTANYILTQMAGGLDYAVALADAQAKGFAEPDPADDIDGHDVVAKLRILAAVAFGRPLDAGEVVRSGIGGVTLDAVQQSVRDGCRTKHVAKLRAHPKLGGEPCIEARVEPLSLSLADPLSRINGVMNAVVVETDTVREVTIVGPGAGPEQAGQGMFADLVSVARLVVHLHQVKPFRRGDRA